MDIHAKFVPKGRQLSENVARETRSCPREDGENSALDRHPYRGMENLPAPSLGGDDSIGCPSSCN